MDYPTNEPSVDFSVLRVFASLRSVLNASHWDAAPKIDENIRNPLIFLRKMAACSCFAGPIDMKIHANTDFHVHLSLGSLYLLFGSFSIGKSGFS